MNRGIVILLLVFPPLILSATDFNSLSNNTRAVNFESSYDTTPFHLYFDYLTADLVCMNPNSTLHFSSASRSGDLGYGATIRVEKNGLGHWAYNFNSDPHIGFVFCDDVDTNAVIANVQNIIEAPTNMNNEFCCFTNEGGWASTQHITWVINGTSPNEAFDGSPATYGGPNNTGTNLAAQNGILGIDLWNHLENPYWSNDFAGAQLVWSSDASHPSPAGHLNIALTTAQQMAVDTNVWDFNVNWNGTSVSTNHCVVSSLSNSGGSLSFTLHLDRMMGAWDVPDGTITNDARNAFVVIPPQGNAFNEKVRVTGLPSGQYLLSLDGSNLVTLSDVQLAAGWNTFTNYAGALWAQKKEVLGRIRDKHGTDRVTLIDHAANVTGALGNDLVNYNSFANAFWATNSDRGDTLISLNNFLEADLQNYDAAIHTAAVQTNHTLTISQPLALCAPFHR
jgi:hypothetical protein